MEDAKQDKNITSKVQVDKSLKIIASIIVERIIEDQRNGNLRLKNQNRK